MSYNGTGIYTLPGAQLINGEVVSATENNQFRNDVATALNTAWTRDGQAPATGNIPMNNHKFTDLLPGTNPGDSVEYEQVTSNVSITGGAIDGTPIGETTPDSGKFTIVESTTGGYVFPDGSIQTQAAPSAPEPIWNIYPATDVYTVPEGIYKIRAYAFGAGGNGGVGAGSLGGNAGGGGGGGGGGCAFGEIPVAPGSTVDITIASGIATLSIAGTDYLVANKGSNGSNGSGSSAGAGGAGGSASIHASVENGGAYSGGTGGSGGAGAGIRNGGGGGGGSSGSPLGNGYAGGNGSLPRTSTPVKLGGPGGGGGIGGKGGDGYADANGGVGGGGGGAGGAGGNANNIQSVGGGAGGSAVGLTPGVGRAFPNRFADPLLSNAVFGSNAAYVIGASVLEVSQGPGAGGSAYYEQNTGVSGVGGDFAGGAGCKTGGFLGGASGGYGAEIGNHTSYAGGGGGSQSTDYPGGTGGGAIVLIYA